jgi:hypothetical protein
MKMRDPNPAPRGALGWLFGTPEKPATLCNRPVPVTVRLETIGREHSGKTAKKVCFYKGPLQGAIASGLELTADDPRHMSRWMQDALEIYRSLQGRGLLTTLDPEVTEYHLFEADEPRLVFQVREVVGQVLTHTTPESDAAIQDRYAKYVANLSQAHVLEVVIPCPPAEGSSADQTRFEADLQLHASYLREALKVRGTDLPCAVILILNKLDTRFANEAEARAALTDERLRTALGRLVRIAEGSQKVGLGAIFPLTAFGFGNAVPAEEEAGAGRAGRSVAGGASALSHDETEWLLKPNAMPAPFNLTALVWWEIMAGLLLKPADGRERELARLAEMLRGDLEAMEGWYVPLACRGGAPR